MVQLKFSLQIDLKDKDGNLLKTITEENPKCPVKQLIDFLFILAKSEIIELKDTNGDMQEIDLDESVTNASLLTMLALATDDLFGIQLGTGTTTPTVEDYQLETKIAHGDGEGELNYGDMVIGDTTVVGNSVKFTLSRLFTNNSGDNIDVKEVGLVAQCYNVTPEPFYVLIDRTLLNFTVSDGVSGTLTYTISISS